jgi:hypothetical protein
MRKYIVIYLCILALAAFQFVIAYIHIDETAMFARMLLVVLLAMQYGWTDSYRMELGAPYSQPKSGVVQQ